MSDWTGGNGISALDAMFPDLFYLGRLLRPGGIVSVDDYRLPG